MVEFLWDLLFCFTMLVCIVNGLNILLTLVERGFSVVYLNYLVLVYPSIMYQVYFWFTHFNII